MDSDEREIFEYLKTWGENFINAKEICRRAGSKKRYNQSPDWAKVVLIRMAEHGLIESDSQGRYRLKPAAHKGKHQRWVSPEISKILNENGVEVEGVEGEIAPDEHYEQL